MFATLCLLGVALAPSQVAPAPKPARAERREPTGRPGDWLLTPSLAPGQELVYRGTFTEQAAGRNLSLNRTYRVENRVFVLEVAARGTNVAVLTLVKDDAVAGTRPGERVAMKAPENEARSARLEKLQVDMLGRLVPPRGVSLSVPLEGPPALETCFCVPVPAGRLAIDTPWTTQTTDRPEMTWHVAATDIIAGTNCLKIVGEQKSEGWDRGDRPGWRRIEAVWVSPRTGIAQRVERRIEHRQPGRTDPSHTSILSVDLQPTLRLPTALIDELSAAIGQILQLQQTAVPLLEQGPRAGVQLDKLIARAKAILDAQSQTPYREALAQLKGKLEAARRGEAAPPLPSMIAPEPTPSGPRSLAVGQSAPDFIAADFTHPGESVNSRSLRGKPVVMLFYNPASHNLDDVVALLETVTAKHRDVTVLGLAAEGGDRVARQCHDKGWKMTVLNGAGLRSNYGVECTPRLVFIDADGVVQGIVVGWGEETVSEVWAAVSRMLRH